MASVLDLHHLETLVAILETRSVTAAAKRLGVTQSAASHRLAEAQRRLGGRLFQTNLGRTMRPTPAAVALCQAAQRILPELARAEADFMRAAGTDREVVRLGVESYDCYHWLPGFHTHTKDAVPDVVLELVVIGDSPVSQLSSGIVDVVLSPGPPSNAADSMTLLTDELVLVTHPDHHLADRDWVDPSALQDEVYLTYSHATAPGFEVDRFLRPAGVAPKTLLIIEQPGAIAEMVASGLGVSILSRWAMTPWINAGKVAAVRCGERGLDLEWRSLLRPGTDEASAELRVARELARWLTAER